MPAAPWLVGVIVALVIAVPTAVGALVFRGSASTSSTSGLPGGLGGGAAGGGAAGGGAAGAGSERLGEYFTLSEFLRSAKADELGIVNTAPAQHIANMRALVNAVLDPIRRALGQPLNISSGYRNPELNRAVDGADGSFHALGWAADINTAGMTNQQLARFIIDLGVPFTELIWYGHKGHVHIAYVVGRNEREVLYQPSKGADYEVRLP